MTRESFTNNCAAIITRLNNVSNSKDDVFSVINLFHSHIQRFSDEDIISYIIELKQHLNQPLSKSKLNFIAYSPEIRGVFLEELERIRKTILQKKEEIIEKDIPLESTDSKEKTREQLIKETIEEWIPESISIKDKENLKELLSINTIQKRINWLRNYESLVRCINKLYDNGLIKFPSGVGTKEFAIKYFTIKGKYINKGSIANACTKEGYRQ